MCRRCAKSFGTKDSLDPNVANGHQARRYIAARDSLNDPYRMVEDYVNTSYGSLRTVVRDSVLSADSTIEEGSDRNHIFVSRTTTYSQATSVAKHGYSIPGITDTRRSRLGD